MSADLSQTPTEVLEIGLKRTLELQELAIAAGALHLASKFTPSLAAINAELQRRQKDESK